MSLGGRHSKHDFSSLVLLGHCWKFFQEPGQLLLLNMSYSIGQQGLPRGNGSVLTLCWRLVAKNHGVERCGFRTAFLHKSRHARPGMHANCDDPCVMQNSIMYDQGKLWEWSGDHDVQNILTNPWGTWWPWVIKSHPR